MSGSAHGSRAGLGAAALLALLAGCSSSENSKFAGGGGGTPPPFTTVTQVRVSQAVSLIPNCDGAMVTGTLYPNTDVTPALAVHPLLPANMVAAWQQNVWSDGGAQIVALAASFDGGNTWTQSSAAFTRCSGGASSNAGDFARAGQASVAYSSTGTVYAAAASFTGTPLLAGSFSGILVTSSADGGLTWALPVSLIVDGGSFFDERVTVAADPVVPAYAYVVWDRVSSTGDGATYFSVSADGGSTWTPGSPVYIPGIGNTTIGNEIVVLPSGVLLVVFTELDTVGGVQNQTLRAISSPDHGTTWSAPATIAIIQAVGTSDPASGQPVRDGAGLASVSVAANGTVYVAWQDSRFSSGARDGIALSSSKDAGITWSTPLQVNAVTSAQAFTPTIDALSDGLIAVTYYDLRTNGTNPIAGSLFADCWMVTSSDGTNFTEQHLSGAFDLLLAPKSPGPYLGDRQALASNNLGQILPLYVEPNPPQATASPAIASDAFIAFPGPTP
ncbi:MAG TPA: sialidase family protein [Steroidobacteraceae bacterium]|jgi:hypothetical protein|nr:sialidase family protein [Steroidobacteraceae bacterium]